MKFFYTLIQFKAKKHLRYVVTIVIGALLFLSVCYFVCNRKEHCNIVRKNNIKRNHLSPEKIMKHGKKKWLLIDGNNLAFRCFYGVPTMTTSEGLHVNAIHGWIRSIWKLEDIVLPDAICVFFDSGGSIERKNILSSYKANRKPMPEELKEQLHYLKLISIAFGYYVISEEGIEADDLLFTFAKKLEQLDEVSYIVSGDKDFAQCLSEHIVQLIPPLNTQSHRSDWTILTKEEVKEKFGVHAEQIVDYLSLLGDTADNIPGVNGIGKKRAMALLDQFQSIEGIFQNIDKISSRGIRTSLINSKELAKKNKNLITLHEIQGISIPEAKINRNTEDVFKLLETLQLNTLLLSANKRYQMQLEFF